MPNGIDLILADHQTVAALFDLFDASESASVAAQVIDALKAHDDAEQAALYPFAAEVLDDPGLLERAQLAHSAVKKQFDVIGALEGAPFVSAVQALQTLVTDHVADEERNLLPALVSAATADQLDALGARVLQAKQRGG